MLYHGGHGFITARCGEFPNSKFMTSRTAYTLVELLSEFKAKKPESKVDKTVNVSGSVSVK